MEKESEKGESKVKYISSVLNMIGRLFIWLWILLYIRHLALPRTNEEDPPEVDRNWSDLVDDPEDELLQLLPNKRSILDFNQWGWHLNYTSEFLLNVVNPGSTYYPYIQRYVDPLVFVPDEQETDDGFEAQLHFLFWYPVRFYFENATFYDLAPNHIDISPVEGYKQQLDITVGFPNVRFDMNFALKHDESNPATSAMKMSVLVRRPVLKFRLKLSYMTCGFRMCYFNLENLVRDAGRILMSEGVEAAKNKIGKVLKSTIYDAEVEDFVLSYHSTDVRGVTWDVIIPQRRSISGKAAFLRHSINAGACIFISACRTYLNQLMKESFKKLIEEHRPDFYRST